MRGRSWTMPLALGRNTQFSDSFLDRQGNAISQICTALDIPSCMSCLEITQAWNAGSATGGMRLNCIFVEVGSSNFGLSGFPTFFNSQLPRLCPSKRKRLVTVNNALFAASCDFGLDFGSRSSKSLIYKTI